MSAEKLEYNADQIASLYDELAPVYADFYSDYDDAVRKQGKDLAKVLKQYGVDPESRVLDCSAGIGTQAIGLSRQGYLMSACDISPLSMEQAQQNAASFGENISLAVSDMRYLQSTYKGQSFDAVISCGNSLAHMLTDQDMDNVFSGVKTLFGEGKGVFLAALTDHENGTREQGVFYDPHVKYERDQKVINFQLWQWIEEGVTYICDDYTITDTGNEAKTKKVSAPFRIWRKAHLFEIAKKHGFQSCDWITPDQSGHHNPIFCAVL